MPKRKEGERRWDRYGEFRLIHVAELHAMVRRVRGPVLVMPMADWLRLGTTPAEGERVEWNSAFKGVRIVVDNTKAATT